MSDDWDDPELYEPERPPAEIRSPWDRENADAPPERDSTKVGTARRAKVGMARGARPRRR